MKKIKGLDKFKKELKKYLFNKIVGSKSIQFNILYS